MVGRRLGGYSLLSQNLSDESPLANNRVSESSYEESSTLSGDCYPPPTIPTIALDPIPDVKAFEGDHGGGGGGGAASVSAGSGSISKSWAQQAEEAYQLQLAFALRLCSQAACVTEPNFLEAADQLIPLQPLNSAESVSHRFWVNGCLSYQDKIPDGFYLIQGMDPFVWALCNDIQDSNRIPSIESLKMVEPTESSFEVVIIDKMVDPDLRNLHSMVMSVSSNPAYLPKDIVENLARIVCAHMGGTDSNEEHELVPRWKESSDFVKIASGSVVFPIGKLSVGLCRHRSLLFKTLADLMNLPCRVVRGCRYCKKDAGTSCLVRFGPEREYLVDLIGNPGCLHEPDSLLNGLSSISISSPMHLPNYKSVCFATNFKSLAKQYFLDCQSLDLMLSDASPGGEAAEVQDAIGSIVEPNSSNVTNQDTRPSVKLYDDNNLPNKLNQACNAFVKPDKHISDFGIAQEGQCGQGSNPFNDISIAIHDLIIPWSELALKEKIGAGSFGTVHRADWHGSDVAVKILMEQDFHPERLKEFLREVAIMKSLRHPNIVLLMGAVTQPPNLSIVTEYLSRGSLYRLLHKPGARETLDVKRCLSMAFDVAQGMNYLHKRNPPIVHRDLKSPNLLVDKKYTVKVCDFGLSRMKAKTFLSSKTAAGTPEWMAPEVLRDEPSNEKSDVYSFGVILWELMTLQQPWNNLNPAQVVAAVGFKGRRLDIPSDVNPSVASLIQSCWADESWKRPSFSSIMDSLKPLMKTLTPSPSLGET
ncbi:protein kinase family protein [Rhynchospora pubera]|uniref:non-specific serine/threonine protein kinase n=1 Tax=Rhynchospora pubera TaxID=906938 RepID=A0AAV8DA04_9POAL|nr:protein kinase family protein [Rhynchospora pubera]